MYVDKELTMSMLLCYSTSYESTLLVISIFTVTFYMQLKYTSFSTKYILWCHAGYVESLLVTIDYGYISVW